MAETAKDFRDAERRKMRLQAMLAAKRASLITMGPPGLPPGRAKADANNAAALEYLRNAGGPLGPQSLDTLEASGLKMDPFGTLDNTGPFPQVANSPYTKALNTRVADLTADDQYRAGLGEGSQFHQGVLDDLHNESFSRGGTESDYPQSMIDERHDQSPSQLPYDPSLLAAVGGVGIKKRTPGSATGVDPRTRQAPTWRPPMRYPGYPGVSPEPTQSNAPPQVSAVAPNQSGGQSSYGPGLTPAAAEELYGPGGMYSTQPLPGGLYDQQGISTSSSPFPWQRQTKSGSPQQIKSGSDHLVDEIKLIAKRKAIIAGSAALFGNVSDGRKAAERYEAKALASLGIYAGKYALSNLNDSDFQSNQKLFQALHTNGMPLDQIAKVINMKLIPDAGGFVDLHNHDTDAVWTGRVDSLEFIKKIKTGDWHKDKRVSDPRSSVMGFVDLKGVKHLGYVQHDENGIPRYFLRDGVKVPDGWDMVSPTAASSKTEITNNLGQQGEKMTEARQIAMAKMSRKWSNDAASYFFDEAGSFKADRLDIMLTSLNVPGEGRLAWTQMKSALASTLRLESGAAISVEEAAKFKSRFFPDATDTERTIIWKLRAFSDYVRALEEINNPQWVYDNLPHTIWNPIKVKTEKERDALPPGSYFTTPNGSLHKLPHLSDSEVQLP